MKKLRFLFVALVMMTVATTVHAEVKAGSFSITPFVGGYFLKIIKILKTQLLSVYAQVIILLKFGIGSVCQFFNNRNQ